MVDIMALNASTKKMVGAAVLSLAALTPSFNANAEAVHPILDTSTSATAYRGHLIKAVDAARVPGAQELARGAVVDLEAALQQPSNKPKIVYFPADAGVGNPRMVIGIAPDKTAPILACVEGGGYFAKWEVANNGSVTSNGDKLQTTQGLTPCQSWLRTAIKKTPSTLEQKNIPVKAQGQEAIK